MNVHLLQIYSVGTLSAFFNAETSLLCFLMKNALSFIFSRWKSRKLLKLKPSEVSRLGRSQLVLGIMSEGLIEEIVLHTFKDELWFGV